MVPTRVLKVEKEALVLKKETTRKLNDEKARTLSTTRPITFAALMRLMSSPPRMTMYAWEITNIKAPMNMPITHAESM